LRGTPLLYYGEEIGMENNDPTRVEEVKDPVGQRFWPKNKGRDGERTPMQWSDAANAGFTTGTPWLPAPDSYRTHNVKAEEGDPQSILSWYRGLIELRQAPALLDGKYVPLLETDANLLAFRREAPTGVGFTVLLNMSAQEQQVPLSALPGKSADVVAESTASRPFACAAEKRGRAEACAAAPAVIALQPYEAMVLRDRDAR